MRIARVIGKVTMTVQMPDILPGSYLIVRTANRRTLEANCCQLCITAVYPPILNTSAPRVYLHPGEERFVFVTLQYILCIATHLV